VRRILELINTPIAALVVLVIVVVLNVLVFYAYKAPTVAPPMPASSPTERTNPTETSGGIERTSPVTTLERTQRTRSVEATASSTTLSSPSASP
jgi:cytoskeletal protein RodZ